VRRLGTDDARRVRGEALGAGEEGELVDDGPDGFEALDLLDGRSLLRRARRRGGLALLLERLHDAVAARGQLQFRLESVQAVVDQMLHGPGRGHRAQGAGVGTGGQTELDQPVRGLGVGLGGDLVGIVAHALAQQPAVERFLISVDAQEVQTWLRHGSPLCARPVPIFPQEIPRVTPVAPCVERRGCARGGGSCSKRHVQYAASCTRTVSFEGCPNGRVVLARRKHRKRTNHSILGEIVKRSVAGTTTGLVRVGARAAATLLAGGLLTLAGQGIAQAAGNGPASAPAGTQATATGAGSDSLTEVAAGAAADLAKSVTDGLLNHDWGVPHPTVPDSHDWGVPQPAVPDNHDWGVPPV